MYVFRGLTLRRVLWRMTCSRGLLIQHRCLSKAASSVCNTRPGLGEALGAALQRGCKAAKETKIHVAVINLRTTNARLTDINPKVSSKS